jgi:TolA-binding protein
VNRQGSIVACLVLLAVLAGCSGDAPEGEPQDWYDEARALESENGFYQEDREGAPLGALEYYQACLDSGHFEGDTVAHIRERAQWMAALKLVTAEDSLGKCDYPAAIEAMTAFRRDWPKSPDAPLALFYRGLAKEYDLDRQDTAGAMADYRQFLEEYPSHSLATEAWIRIAHCQEFNLDRPDYAAAVKTYDHILATYQAEVVRRGVQADSDDASVTDLPMLLAVERALYNKALILENHLALEAGADETRRRQCYEQAVACYRELLHERYFGQTRFKQTQFVMFRLGVVLAENLGRVDEGVAVLKEMEKRWPESPWYGRVLWKRQQIEKAAEKR